MAEKEKCHCSSDGFYITNRQTSMLCSFLILLALIIFISGYFWGHGRATQEFTEKLVDDSFTDKINYAFYSNFEKSPSEQSEVESGDEDFEEVETVNSNEVVKETDTQKAEEKVPDTLYYAELVGFGTLRAAQQFVEKASQHGYNIDIKQRASKTPKGKTLYWFQAVTEKLEDKDKLMDLVTRIQKSEKIKDVKIISTKG